MTDCSNVPSLETVEDTNTNMIVFNEVVTSPAQTTPTAASDGNHKQTLQAKLDALGVKFDDPIPDWAPGEEITEFKAYYSPDGDVIIPTAPRPFTTGLTFTDDNWTILQGLTARELGGYTSYVCSSLQDLKEGKPVGGDIGNIGSVINGQVVYLSDPVRFGKFVWNSDDLSSEATSDTQEGIYITKVGEDGSLGAWVREFKGSITPEMFGGSDSGYTAAKNFILNLAILNGDTIGLPSILMSGIYSFTSTIEIAPWIKHKSEGSAVISFEGALDTVAAIRIKNDLAPSTTTWKNAANTGAIFSGSFLLVGPGLSGSSVGITIGNDTDLPESNDCRDAVIGDIVVSNFATLFDTVPNDIYLMSLQNSRLETAGTSVLSYSGLNVNSGERLTFINDTFAGSPLGVDLDSDAIDLVFLGCSFDFCRSVLMQFGAGSGFQKVSFVCCHLEASNDIALVDAQTSDKKIMVTITDSKIVPRNNDTALPLTRPDKKSVPRIPLFKGRIALSINGLQFGGYERNLANAEGLFLCDSDVEILSIRGVHFTGFRQAIAEKSVVNFNWDFRLSGTGSIDARSTKGWRNIFRTSTITGTVIDTASFGDSTKALKIETTFGQSDSYEIESNLFTVEQALPLVNQHVVYGGGTTGLIRVQAKLRAYAYDESAALPTISGIDRSGTLATVTTTSAHLVDAGQKVDVSGADQPEYNGLKTVVSTPTPTTFTYCVNDLATTPATTSTTLSAERDKFRFIGETDNLGSEFATRYNDTDDPSYTGSRAYWAKEKFLYPTPDFSSRFRGATHGRLILVVSGLDVGDELLIGGALVCKLY